MKKAIAILTVLAVVMTSFAGCGASGGGSETGGGQETVTGGEAVALSGKDISNDALKIAMIPISTAGYTTVLSEKAVQDIQEGYPNLKVDFFDAGYDATTQNTLISECIAQGYDAVILEAADPVAVSPVVREAEAAGVVVITLNMGCDAIHTLHLESDSYNAGWIAGETITNALNGEGKVILLDVPAELKASAHHGTGFEDYIAENSNFDLIDYQNVAGFSQEEANTIMRDLLTKHDQIDAVFAVSDDEAMGVLQAINSAGRQNDGILVFGAEGLPSAFNAIEEGTLYGTAWSDRFSVVKTILNMSLYFIASGINANKLGYTYTPAVKAPFYAVTAENVKNVMSQSHWPDYE
jgi:ribose transport system substrate-binding protein